jgi:hypothetical protein
MDSVSRSGPSAPEPWGNVKQSYQVTAGDQVIMLEETPIAEVAAALGGATHSWGEAGEAVTWACFARGAETFWLYSDGEMGDGKVTGVALDARDAPPASAQCADWPVSMSVDLGIMGIGLPKDAIIPNYQTSEPDDYGWMRSVNLTPDPKDPAFQVWQELTFRESDGVINAVAVLQETANYLQAGKAKPRATVSHGVKRNDVGPGKLRRRCRRRLRSRRARAAHSHGPRRFRCSSCHRWPR